MMVKEAAGSADWKCREVTQKIGTDIAIMHSAGLNISEKILRSLGMLSIFFFDAPFEFIHTLHSGIFHGSSWLCFHTQISHE